MTIGIPKAFYYYRYGELWRTFFRTLGCEVILSPDTNKQFLTEGSKYSIDEGCLSMKIYLGHVKWLLSRCDYVFVPPHRQFWLGGHRRKKICCPRFEALHDVVRNTFRAQADQILGCQIDYIDVNKSLGVHTEEHAFLELGRALGASRSGNGARLPPRQGCRQAGSRRGRTAPGDAACRQRYKNSAGRPWLRAPRSFCGRTGPTDAPVPGRKNDLFRCAGPRRLPESRRSPQSHSALGRSTGKFSAQCNCAAAAWTV